jgi:hypothetical protein
MMFLHYKAYSDKSEASDEWMKCENLDEVKVAAKGLREGAEEGHILLNETERITGLSLWATDEDGRTVWEE